jgi:hypothetical protein
MTELAQTFRVSARDPSVPKTISNAVLRIEIGIDDAPIVSSPPIRSVLFVYSNKEHLICSAG